MASGDKKGPKKPQETRPKEADSLLWREYFNAGDERFLRELLSLKWDTGSVFKRLPKEWYFDSRPFAREALLRYIDDGCDRPRHRLLIKKLFKLCELNNDQEAMARFLVVFDRYHHRRLVESSGYNPRSRKQETKKLLVGDQDITRCFKSKKESAAATRFSRVTRLYLQRRAFRFFRTLARKDPARYWERVKDILSRYRDEQLQKPEHLLDAWGLLHILYWGSPVLSRQPRGILLQKGRSLSELGPAPFCPKVWSGRFLELFTMLLEIESRTVRSFLVALLARDYDVELHGLSLSQRKRLLLSRHQELQELGAELLRESKDIDQLSVQDWLSLLQIESPFLVPILCELVVRHLHPEQLSLSQCVQLARTRVAPIAELGLRWTREKPLESGSLSTLMALGNAETAGVRAEAVDFLLGELAADPQSTAEQLRELLDSRFEEVRARALSLMQNDPRFRDSLALWASLSESPYDDVRAYLLRHLKTREELFRPETLQFVWASSLLAIHRGSKAKKVVLRQLSMKIVEVCQRPDRVSEVEALLPLVAIALRSVRPAERRGALGALARAVFVTERDAKTPSLRRALERHLPELKLFSEEVV